jgi:hypothetical protein
MALVNHTNMKKYEKKQSLVFGLRKNITSSSS